MLKRDIEISCREYKNYLKELEFRYNNREDMFEKMIKVLADNE